MANIIHLIAPQGIEIKIFDENPDETEFHLIVPQGIEIWYS